jgi:hypothetical protein
VGEVGVHLDQEVGAGGHGVREAREVGGADAFLAGAVKHLDVRDLGRHAVGDLARSVGRAVVDHDHAVLEAGGGEVRQRCPHDRLQVLGLVVGRQHEPGAGHGRVP